MTSQARICLMLALFAMPLLQAQEQEVVRDSIDEKYREDQFYFGITYNMISNVPDNVNLKGLTGGLQLGYLRDMPINEQRNWAIAIGLGISFDQYGQNLLITEDEERNTVFRVIDQEFIDYDANRFSTYTIELPLQVRWRTSTPSAYQFWRVYAGVRVGYSYWYQSKFKQEGLEIKQENIDEFDPWRLSANLSAGYGPFNVFVQYHLTPFFENARTNQTQEEIGFQPLKLGIIFYIL